MEGTHDKPLLGQDSPDAPPKGDVESNTKVVFKKRKKKCGPCRFCGKVMCVCIAMVFLFIFLFILVPVLRDIHLGPTITGVEWSSPHSQLRENNLRALTDRINQGHKTWKARYNPFGHSTWESATLGNPIEIGRDRVIEVVEGAVHSVAEGVSPDDRMADTLEHLRDMKRNKWETITLPSSFDAREKWARCSSVHQISNQGACGSCWAMAATSVMSDRLCISSNFTRQGTVSAQDLLSCCPSCGSCGGGGFLISPFVQWRDRGFVSGGSYGSNEGCKPYQIDNKCGIPCAIDYYTKNRTPKCEEKCNPLYGKSYTDDLIKSRKAYWLRTDPYYEESMDWRVIEQKKIRDAIEKEMPSLRHPWRDNYASWERFLKVELMIYGPVMGCLLIAEDLLLYDSGIYDRYMSDLMYSHCMKLIGWGEEGGVKYWIYANSWGRNWGENGFVRMRIDSIPVDIASGIF